MCPIVGAAHDCRLASVGSDPAKSAPPSTAVRAEPAIRDGRLCRNRWDYGTGVRGCRVTLALATPRSVIDRFVAKLVEAFNVVFHCLEDICGVTFPVRFWYVTIGRPRTKGAR